MASATPWLSLPGLSLLVAANSAPVVAAWLAGRRGAWPLDGGLLLRDGQRLLGPHKTWRGLAAAVLAGGGAAAALGLSAWHGALAGAGAIAGDALSSFVKRRRRLGAGTWSPLLDQLPEAVLPLLLLWTPLGLDVQRLAGTVVAFVVLDLVASRTLGSSRGQRSAPPHGAGPSAHARGDEDQGHWHAAMNQKHVRAKLVELRDRLAARRQRIDKHLHHRDEPLPPKPEDLASELVNRETMESLDGETEIELHQVEHALARLDAGLYGICESCRRPIGSDRLQLIPFATKCVSCAAQP